MREEDPRIDTALAEFDRAQDERIAPQKVVVDKWLIWSHEHSAWWKHEGRGYTVDVADAGRFTLQGARAICTNANIYLRPGGPPNEVMTPAPEEIMGYVVTGARP